MSLDGLFEFLRIPSISADGAHTGDVERAAEWVVGLVEQGGGHAAVVNWHGSPLVVGELTASRDTTTAPDVFCYGHFDVQPVDPVELWESDPFEPEIRGGWLYGRGAADDKGQLWMLLTAAAALAHEGRLPVNVRVICDGEEEIGGRSLAEFVAADARGAKACIVFDGGMLDRRTPVLNLGLRGLCYLHMRVQTAERDLHSGLYGGAAVNALHVLLRCLDAVVGRDGELPTELQRGARPPAPEEVDGWSVLRSGRQVLDEQGALPLNGAVGDDFYLRTWARPAVDVNGIEGGSARLLKTVMPAVAHANLSMRLAPGQDVDEMAGALERLLRAAAPPRAQVDVSVVSRVQPALFSRDALPIKLASQVFENVTGFTPVLVRSGGSLPFAAALAGRGIPFVGTGFDLPEGNVHSPNERLLVDHIPLGIEVARGLLMAFAQLQDAH
jgi:acetylornithine deacetylase/succinyl-diaminopimelate desuccinylase-like protein